MPSPRCCRWSPLRCCCWRSPWSKRRRLSRPPFRAFAAVHNAELLLLDPATSLTRCCRTPPQGAAGGSNSTSRGGGAEGRGTGGTQRRHRRGDMRKRRGGELPHPQVWREALRWLWVGFVGHRPVLLASTTSAATTPCAPTVA